MSRIKGCRFVAEETRSMGLAAAKLRHKVGDLHRLVVPLFHSEVDESVYNHRCLRDRRKG
jgi:hypothetical protein